MSRTLFILRLWSRCCLAAVLTVPLTATPLVAQSLHVETFTGDEGLPSLQIYDLAQTPDGHLWIAHRRGVTSFDGRRFKSFTAADGLPERELGSLALGPDGQPWTVTRWAPPRVFHLRGTTWQGLPVPSTPGDPLRLQSALVVMGPAERPRVAVGSAVDGLFYWDGGAWEHWDENRGLSSSRVYDLAAFGETIAVATRHGLCFLEAGRVRCDPSPESPRLSSRLLALHVEERPSGRSRLWILGRDWLGFLQDGRLTVVVDELDFDALELSSHGVLGVGRANDVYLGSEYQAFQLDLAAGTAPRPTPLGLRQGLASDGVTTFLRDREGNVWLGSLRGLSRIENRRFLSFDEEHGLLEDEVTALLELAPGRLLLGHNVGLTLLENGRVSRTWSFAEAFDASPPGPANSFRVIDLAPAADGGAWLAAHRLGLLHLGPDLHLSRVGVAERVYTVESDARGDLWISAGKQLYVRRDGRFRRVRPQVSPTVSGHFEEEENFYRWLVATPDGRIFVGTERGLLWHDGRRDLDRGWQKASGPTSASNILYSILPRPDGTVWVGTSVGIFELADHRLVRPAAAELALDRPVYFLLPEGARTWFGTDDGVFLWDGEHRRQLTLEHGLAGRETNRGAALVDHEGRVWIGTVRGLSLYQERHDRPPSAPPLVELTEIEVNGVARQLDDSARLSYRENNLTFQFGTVAFSRALPVEVRYRLEPLEKSWRQTDPAESSEVNYSHLPPGAYRFRIATRFEGEEWGREVASTTIRVGAPFWRRPAVLAGSFLLVALVVFGGFRLRTASIRRRNLELVSVVSELERLERERRELIAELESRNAELERFVYTVSHDLKSPLFTVEGFLGFLETDALAGDADRLRRDVAQIRAATDKMGRLLRELLELSRIGRVANPSAEVSLSALARDARDLVLGDGEGDGDVEVEIDPHLPVVRGDATRLLEVFQNLLENAVKYMGDTPRPRIEIGQRKASDENSDDGPVIFVRDNGSGIEPAYHDKIFGLFERLETVSEGTGIGLALVRRIVEVHGGRVWVESAGAGHGSTFCFTLPPRPGPLDSTALSCAADLG